MYESSIELENEIDDSHQEISKSLTDTIWYFDQICIPEDHMGFALLHAKVGLLFEVPKNRAKNNVHF